MEHVPMEVLRWRDLSQRLAELEARNGVLKRRLLLGVALNALLLVGVLSWLASPTRSLNVDFLKANDVIADSITIGRTTLRPDGVVVTNAEGTARVRLHMSEEDVPTVSVEHDGHGQVVLGVADAPFLGLYADNPNGGPGSGQPQIEMSLVGREKSPQIVLRDVQGTITWQAP